MHMLVTMSLRQDRRLPRTELCSSSTVSKSGLRGERRRRWQGLLPGLEPTFKLIEDFLPAPTPTPPAHHQPSRNAQTVDFKITDLPCQTTTKVVVWQTLSQRLSSKSTFGNRPKFDGLLLL